MGQVGSWTQMLWWLSLVCLLAPKEAKRVSGTLHTDARWSFITRFCFLTRQGTLSYEFKYPVAYGTQEVLLYYDTPGQWDAVYKTGKTCEQMYSVLSPASNQIVALNTSNTQTSTFSGCRLINHLGATWYNCTGDRSFRSTRERWWYIVFARCGEAKSQVTGLYMDYNIHMTNGNDLLHKEYSADEFYVLPVDITFLVLYFIIGTLSCVCAMKLRRRQLFHTTYKIYLTAVIVWILHLIIKVIAWSYLGVTGWEVDSVEVTGRCFRELSNIVFILMLILMAKGYTITRGSLAKTSTVKITVFMLVFFLLTVVLFVWEGIFFDAGKVLYYYESPPGYCMVSLRLVSWVWFVYAIIFTLKHTAKKSLFYIPFFAFFTLWFWAGPITILVAMFAMPKWSREKTVNGVEQLIGFMGHVFFLYLTRPSAANSNFPYHVRTSQIATFGNDDIVLGDQNPYFISGRADFTGTGPDLEFFITSKDSSARNDEGEHMYRPLDAEFYKFDNPPPPSYPQATDCDHSISVMVNATPNVNPTSQPTVVSNIATTINREVGVAPGSLTHPDSLTHPETHVLAPIGFNGRPGPQGHSLPALSQLSPLPPIPLTPSDSLTDNDTKKSK